MKKEPMSTEMKVAIVGAIVAGFFGLLGVLIEVFGPDIHIENTYAILYEDNTFVFQHGKNEEDDKRAVRIYHVNLAGYSYNKRTNKSSVPWYTMRNKIEKVIFADIIQPKSTAYWFFDCRKLNNIEGILRLDTSKTTDMSGMFCGCNSLVTLDVSGFDTSNVTNMRNMFYDCNRLITLDVSGFNTSNVTDMSGMFHWCTSLDRLNVRRFDASGVFDTSSVTDMSNMFRSCNSLTTLDVNKFNTSNVINMSGMFAQCSNLATLNVREFDTSSVTDMSNMFRGCNSLKTLDVSKFNTSNVTDMNSMFDGCKSLVTIYSSDNFIIDQVQHSERMFSACYNLKGGSGTVMEYSMSYDIRRTTAKYAHIDGGPSNPGYFTAKR